MSFEGPPTEKQEEMDDEIAMGRRLEAVQDKVKREEAEHEMTPVWYLMLRLKDGEERELDLPVSTFELINRYLPENTHGRANPFDANRLRDRVGFMITHDSMGFLEKRDGKIVAGRYRNERTDEM